MGTNAQACVVALLASWPGLLPAQDVAVVGPDIYKCEFENERARLCEVTFKPGARIGFHSHPDHLVYVLAPGRLRVTGEDGRTHDVQFEAGQTIWSEAESHSAINPGAAEVRGIIVEFKERTRDRGPRSRRDNAAHHRPLDD